ncbi:hypothetical protein [Photobacterium satsumensis]|uniref:hypothetical protein n=1 Tax=Photobacterium satsumensis TaxID=2910239 RepID=UPI003D0ABCA0
MSRLCRYAIAVCLLFLLPAKGNASAVDVELNYYSKASHLVNAGRYQQASQQWHRLTILFLSSEAKLGRKRMWQYAGLSEALAAISADKANDAIAYQYWADSTRYLMTGGTNWKQMKKKLHRRYEHANTLLSTQLQVADLAASIDSEWENELAVLQSWDEKLSLFSFESPKLGLTDRQERLTSSQPVTIQPKVNPVYQPPQGGKKLSGLNTSYSKEQHVIPSGSPAQYQPIPESSSATASSALKISGEAASEPAPSGSDESSAKTEVKIIATPTETSVSRHLVVSDAEVKLQTVPVMSKGIVISGPTPAEATQSPTTEKAQGLEETTPVNEPDPVPVTEKPANTKTPSSGSSDKVLVTPLEEIEYEEQDLKQLVTPNKQSQNQPLKVLETEKMTLPSGHFEQPEKHNVAPLQRRSFAPVSQ